MLDEKGRCCGRKPIMYKGGAWNSPERQRFCTRCCASYNFETGEQIANWAFKKNALGEFENVMASKKEGGQ